MSLPDADFPNATALVTGGSSGIGRAIAEELIARGVRRMIIVGQNEQRLAEAAGAMQTASPDLTVKTVSIDLSDREGPAKLQRQIQQWNWTVDYLVNNAGFGRKCVFGEDFESDTSLRTTDLMVRAVVELSLRYLPEMKERRRGGILNVGSTAAFQPVPYTAMYAASKAFVHSFSQAIREESRDTGVRMACIIPGVTDTNLDGQGHGERRGVIDWVGIDQPADVAKAAVDALEKNSPAQVIGWNNKAFHAGLSVLTDSTKASLVAASRGAPGTKGEA